MVYHMVSNTKYNMKIKINELLITLTVVFLLFIIFEFFSFYRLEVSKNDKKVEKEYLPLLKHSKISENDLENHFKNITNLGIKNNKLREYHPNLIYLYKPNLRSETFYTNSFGLLDDEPNLSKKQILLLGSSVVGSGLRQNFKENIDQYLEKQIHEAFGDNTFEVLNAGIGGYISNQEFNLMHSLSSKINFEKLIYFRS